MTDERALAVNDDPGFDVPGMLVMVMSMMMLLMMANVMPAVAQTMEAQAYRGKTVSQEVTAASDLRWLDLIHDVYPYTPWVSAYFINHGPQAVELAINYPNERFVLKPQETATVSRLGAVERIAIIFYICAPGETAALRITGEY